jgi:hypothetical protein
MYLYIEGQRLVRRPAQPKYYLLAKGTEKVLDKLWNSINRLNKGDEPYIFMTVKPLPEH